MIKFYVITKLYKQFISSPKAFILNFFSVPNKHFAKLTAPAGNIKSGVNRQKQHKSQLFCYTNIEIKVQKGKQIIIYFYTKTYYFIQNFNSLFV